MADARPELPLDPDLPPPHASWTGPGLVFAGGMAGTASRYGVGAVVAPWGVWPLATIAVNVTGAFLLGVLLEALGRRGPDVLVRQRIRLLLGTGFLGAFTTYSTLAVEVDSLVRSGSGGVAVLYASASVGAGVVAAMLGIWLASAHHRRWP